MKINFVVRRNLANVPGHEIPEGIADLFENKLGCRTGGKAKHGLRWEYQKTGTIFLENITREGCSVYILPTSERRWKTVEGLKKIIVNCGLSHLENRAGYGGGHDRKHLRVRDVSWGDLKVLAPKLLEWVYVSMTAKLFPRVVQDTHCTK